MAVAMQEDEQVVDSWTNHVRLTGGTAAIFWISVLGLFLEMLLIRWIGTEVRIFAYLQNTVLVVCFMGLGMGCFTSHEPANVRHMLLPLLSIMLLMSIPVTRDILGDISAMLAALGDMVIWPNLASSKSVYTVWDIFMGLAFTFVLMLFIWEIFVPIGRILGRLMNDHPRTIMAYSVNITGSLVGAWLFVLLSAWQQPPIAWFATLAVLTLLFMGKRALKRPLNLALLAGIVILSWVANRESNSLQAFWSPYQKLVVKKYAREASPADRYLVTVNNTGYQLMVDLSKETTARHSEFYHSEMRGLSQYDIPLLLHPGPYSFLAVGAGAGNDVAGALRHGVKKITAVEIDPAIISIGRRYHPERPYGSPDVTLIADDARSFFATCKERYDIISFGLLDSHTTTAMTNARLDHYVYTRESIERAKALLAEGGIMTLSFEAQKPYIADRMARLLEEAFDQEPIAFRIPGSSYGWGGVMFIAGDLEAARGWIAANPRLSSLIGRWQKEYPLVFTSSTRITTDDWPYIYLRSAQIPPLYYILVGMMFLLLLRARRMLRRSGVAAGWRISHWRFFFLGAAFLLLEVQNISKASVALGNTWQVNAVIVSGVLIMILAANLIAARYPKISLGPVYVCLIGICIALYFVDIAQFAFLPYYQKAAVVGILTTLPMLFSGIVFIRSFTIAAEKHTALGANLIGALVGGLLESITFITGIKAILLLVAAFYLGAMLCSPREVEPTRCHL